MRIGIIGAGASGMAAALAAAENNSAQVILFERHARVGRKLQATGNGRCNLSNMHAEISHYHGEDPDFVSCALDMMDAEKTLAWFRGMGLVTVCEPSGKIYPYSDQANSVVDVLRLALNRDNIELRTGFEVQRVRKDQDAFCIIADGEEIYCDRLIIACGGLAGTKLGGSMSGHKLLSKLGHRSTKLRPSLVQIKSNWGALPGLKGVRANCNVRICKDGILYAQSSGELQFTDYGLSGPVIFEISRDVCQGGGHWTASLDMLPQCSVDELREEIQRRCTLEYPIEDILTGVLHNRLGRVLTKAVGITGITSAKEMTQQQVDALARSIKSFEIVLTEPMGMDSAQVTAGGVLTRDFDPRTMESKRISGLYACGEVLDIDGDCGGYNLQWAWSSGWLAGHNAGKDA